MDATPHTHLPRLCQSLGDSGWEIDYGDTTVHCYAWPHILFGRDRRPPSPERIQRTLLKAVRKHDAGSLKAGRAEQQRKDAEASMTEALSKLTVLKPSQYMIGTAKGYALKDGPLQPTERHDEWGSVLLAPTPTEAHSHAHV